MTVMKMARPTVTTAQNRSFGGRPSCAISASCFNDLSNTIRLRQGYGGQDSEWRCPYAQKQDLSIQLTRMFGEKFEQAPVEHIRTFPIERMSDLGHDFKLAARDVRRHHPRHRRRYAEIGVTRNHERRDLESRKARPVDL